MLQDWRAALNSLPSETFLDLMRVYLGQVRTPYRKHELVDKLESLLKKPETIERILSLIDDSDAEVLSALIILPQATRDDVAEFLGGERMQTLLRIVNLEERLLIYESAGPAPGSQGRNAKERAAFERSGVGRRYIRLNPLLAEAFRLRVYDPELVFPPAATLGKKSEVEEEESSSAFPSLDRLDPEAIAALISFFLKDDHAPRRKADGELKLPIKAVREFQSRFPAHWDCHQAAAFLESARLFRFVGGKFCVQKAEAESFFRFEAYSRAKAAAILAGSPTLKAMDTGLPAPSAVPGASGAAGAVEPIHPAPYLAASAQNDAADLIRLAERIIPAGRAFGPKALARFIMSAQIHMSRRARGADASRLLSGMLKAGCLKTDGKGGCLRPAVEATTAESGRIRVGADFHVFTGPGLPSSDGLILALCLDIERLGSALEFSLSRKSAARAYRLGLSREALEAHLTRMSGKPLPQNLSYSLEAWEREHHSVNIVTGIVLCGDDRLAKFMEHSPVMREYLVEKIAPGAYLTRFAGAEEAEEALQRAGMETPPRIMDASGSSEGLPGSDAIASPGQALNLAPQFDTRELSIAETDWERRRQEPTLDPLKIRKELEDSLAASSYPKEIKESLADRIRLKLIIGEAGLMPDSVRYEKSEAGGLDYLGKVKLIEHSLHRSDWLLVILYRDAQGNPDRRSVRPLSLHKTASGLLLDCQTVDGPDEEGEFMKIPVERISNVKRVRLSLFG